MSPRTTSATFGGDQSTAQAINNAGQVTGESQLCNGNFHAFLDSSGTLTDLGTLEANKTDGESFGNGLNAAGTVVGTSDTGATDAAATPSSMRSWTAAAR